MSKEINDALEARKIEICKAFNNKSKNGIAIIKEICGDDASPYPQIARFLINNKDNLNPAEVGDYLSSAGDKIKPRDGAEEQKTENEQVLEHFVSQMNFEGRSIVDALREYLKAFKLPGEAQKIDRLMKAFGDVYIKQNPECGIANKDSAYILAYQIIMLNTDLHNASIAPEKKISLQSLKINLQKVNNDKDFSSEFLEKMYNDIKSTPFEYVSPVKTSIELDQSNLSLQYDPAFKKYSSEAEKPWYSFLTGSITTTVLKDEAGSAARMDISEPGWFGKLIGRKSEVTIRPGADDKAAPSDLDNKLVAKTAAEFMVGARITATYPYQAAEMKAEYDSLQTNNNAPAPIQKEVSQAISTPAANSPKVKRIVAQLKKAGVGGEVPAPPKEKGRARIGSHREGGIS